MSGYKTAGCLVLSAWLGTSTGRAQVADVPSERGWCGATVTPEVYAAELERLASGFYDAAGPRGPGDYKYMRVALHIVRRTNGTGGITIANLQAALNTSNAQFAPSRMVLTPISLDYIDSDTYYTITEPEDELLRQQNVEPGALNMYFVGDAPYCGESSFPDGTPGSPGGSQGIVFQNSCVDGGGVMAHEIGHYFLLLHTHETYFGADCPGNPNCGSLGDLCCDTPPDPGLYRCSNPESPGSCVDSNCAYTGTFTCGGVAYSPDTTNTMSYTDYETCMDGFSADQRVRIASSLTMSDRVDEIMLEHSCGFASFTALGSAIPLGTWEHPMPTIRLGIAAPRPCTPAGGGVLIVERGVYFEGPGLYSTPITITASRVGPGSAVEIRP
jgi:hypothetical protein